MTSPGPATGSAAPQRRRSGTGTFSPSPLPPRPRRLPLAVPVEEQEPAARPSRRAAAPRTAAPIPVASPQAGRGRRATAETPRPQLRVVEPRSKASVLANRLVVVYWTVIVVGILFCAVVMNASLAARQGRLDVLRNGVRSADLEHRRLRAEVAELEAPERIAAIALRQGLERPTELRFLTPVGSAQLAPSTDGAPVEVAP